MKFRKLYELITERISGEYWYDGHSLQYCDGDVCDVNHERMVIDHILSNYNLDSYDEDTVKSVLIYRDELASIIDNEEDFSTSENEIILKLENDYNIDRDEIEDIIRASNDITKDEIDCLFSRTDPRDYGLKHLGWIRIKGNEFDSYELNNEQIRKIGYALSKLEDEGEEFSEDENINLYIFSNKSYYEDVPISVIDSRDLVALREYKR